MELAQVVHATTVKCRVRRQKWQDEALISFKMSYLTTFVIFFLMSISNCWAGISLIGQVNNPRPYYSEASEAELGAAITGKVGFGAGALLEWRLLNWLGLELGGIYTQRNFKTTNTTRSSGTVLGSTYTIDTLVNATLKSYAVELPLIMRLRLGRWIALGFGAYYAYGLGNLGVSTSTKTTVYYSSYTFDGITTADKVLSFEQSRLNRSDYGLTALAGTSFALSKSIALILDGRYFHGFKNISTAQDTTLRWRNIEVLVGLRYESGK